MADASRRDFLKVAASVPAFRFARLEADGTVHDTGAMARDEVLEYLTTENGQFEHIFKQCKVYPRVSEPDYIAELVETMKAEPCLK